MQCARATSSQALLIERLASGTSTASYDAHWGFGQVSIARALDECFARLADTEVIMFGIHQCNHIGRLGHYADLAAERGLVSILTVNGTGPGYGVAPFGGREGRLGTNPIAFGAPTKGNPIVVDFATSSVPEGKVRFLRETGQQLPELTLVNERGEYSTNPSDLYAADGTAAGAILPFGGPLGYKSYGISLMVQILSSLLGAPAWAEDNEYTGSNNLFVLALRIESFMSPDEFQQQLEEMAAYVTSSQPGVASTGVRLPGELEFERMEERRRTGIPLPSEVWSTLESLAAGRGT